MAQKSKSKASGESSVGAEKQRSATPSTSAARLPSTLATLESSQNPPSQIGFQPTPALGEIDDLTASLQVLTAFASKLGALVLWKRLELADGREVIALCFPLDKWEVTPNGSLGVLKAS
jgi:hypothetical protein